MKTLTVKIPDAVFAEIAGDARARNVPKSEIVRERLGRKPVAAQKVKGTLWDRMEDLVIRSDSLPADLSSNKTHLKPMAKSVLVDSGPLVAACGNAISITRGRRRISRRRPSHLSHAMR